MDTWKRISRKPVPTLAWTAALTLAALILGIAASLFVSARAVPAALDARGLTIAVHKVPPEEENEDGSYAFRPELALLYDEDIEYLRSLPQVKDIDLRYLSGAYMEGVTAKLGLSDWYGMKQDISFNIGNRPNAGACGVIFIGTVEGSFTLPYESNARYDLSALGLSADEGELLHCAAFRVEEVVVMHPDYPLYARYDGDEYYDGRVNLVFPAFGDDAECFFKAGGRYAVQGAYDPACSGVGNWPMDMLDKYPLKPNVKQNYSMSLFSTFIEGDELVQYRDIEYEMPAFDPESSVPLGLTLLTSRGERVPAAVKWNGTAEELLADEFWGGLAKKYEMSLSAFPVLGTNNLESMYSFLKNECRIVEGRSFTEEEYETGARVLVMDEGVAKNAGLSVGSKVRLKQFQPAVDTDEGNDSLRTNYYSLTGEYNNPTLGGDVFHHGLPEGEFEEFTIVGLYRLENEWRDALCSFTPNTVFMPRGAQTDKAYGGPSRLIETIERHLTTPDGQEFIYEEPVIEAGGVNGVYMSIVLKNGSVDDFLKRIEDDSEFTEYEYELGGSMIVSKTYTKGLGEHTFLCFDSGFGSAMESMEETVQQAGRLALLMGLGATLIFAAYVLIHQTSERKTLGIMRSLGAKEDRVRSYLFTSGLVIAAAGIIIGTLLSLFLAGRVTDKLVGAALGDDTALFREMLRESAAPVWVYAALAAAETALAAAVLFVHAALTAKKEPRRLLGK